MKGAYTADVEDEPAIHLPNEFIPSCINGQTTASTNETTTEPTMTTSGTNLLPLKNYNASGSLRKL